MLLANYAQIARRSALATAVAGLVMVAISTAVAGSKGLLGSVLGVALVAVFFAISVLAVGRAAKVSPQAMMVTSMITYLAKIVILLFFVVRFASSTVFNTRLFGLTALACILVWSGAQIFWSMRLKTLYVDPAAPRQTVPHIEPDGER
jgi:ATP synthase protein I